MKALLAALLLIAPPSLADDVPATARQAQVVWLGEVHDNPAHHVEQARWVAALAPRALVFEMLTPEQVGAASGVPRDDAAALDAAFGWADSGWPDFAFYAPIFAAAPMARLEGAAVPRDAARAAMADGVAQAFGGRAAEFGLDRALPADVQAAAEAEQMAAHCDALPAEMLPAFVDIQRLRDAALARAALDALDATGGPVVVITGNGHARLDGGAPAYLRTARPDVVQFALGQAETGLLTGQFDAVADASAVDRPDPCAVFRKD